MGRHARPPVTPARKPPDVQYDNPILHCWIPAFNPLHHVGFFDPIWIILKFLPLEYLDSVREVVGLVGTVIAEDPQYSVFDKPGSVLQPTRPQTSFTP
jgi:hypothetical protein